MDPLSILGAAALGAVGACAATDCTEQKPVPPPVVMVQPVAIPKPPEPPYCAPAQVTCAPQQTVNVAPPAPSRKIIVKPPPLPQSPKVGVQVSCPERPPCPAEKAPTVTVSQTVNANTIKDEKDRPEEIMTSVWITKVSLSVHPSISFALGISLSFMLPFAAAGWGKRRRTRQACDRRAT